MTNPEPKTAAQIADAIYVKHFRGDGGFDLSTEDIIPDIAQAIEEAEARGEEKRCARHACDILQLEGFLKHQTAEASVLAGALQEVYNEMTVYAVCDSFRMKEIAKKALDSLTPATRAAMSVLDAAKDLCAYDIHDGDKQWALIETVAHRERVMGGSNNDA